MLLVEEKQPGRIVAVLAFELNHCPIIPRSASCIVQRCSVQMMVAGALMNVLCKAVKDFTIVSPTKCLFFPILGYPSKNYRMNLDGFVIAIPSEGTGGLRITVF